MTPQVPMRRSPFRAIQDIRQEINRLFEESSFSWPAVRNGGKPAVNIVEHDREIVVQAAVPGFSQEELSVEATSDRLILRGEKQETRERDADGYYAREFSCESFSRTITLPTTVQNDAVTAELKGGVLTVTLPKSEPLQRRATRVAITSG